MPERTLKAERKQIKIDNTALIEAITEMRKDFNAETQNKVINVALRSTFLVPAIMEKSTELVADAENHVKFQDQPKAKFVLINHKEKGTFFPAFTSPDEMDKFKKTQSQNFAPFAMKFGDIAQIVETTPNVNGFVINPFHENLPFTKPMLDSIKQTLIKVNKERAEAAKAAADNATAEESDKPDITVTTNNNAEQ